MSKSWNRFPIACVSQVYNVMRRTGQPMNALWIRKSATAPGKRFLKWFSLNATVLIGKFLSGDIECQNLDTTQLVFAGAFFRIRKAEAEDDQLVRSPSPTTQDHVSHRLMPVIP